MVGPPCCARRLDTSVTRYGVLIDITPERPAIAGYIVSTCAACATRSFIAGMNAENHLALVERQAGVRAALCE